MLKKTAQISAVFRDKKREESFKNSHRIGNNAFTRERKLGFDKMMTMIMKKSSKSIQNSLNDMQLELQDDTNIKVNSYIEAKEIYHIYLLRSKIEAMFKFLKDVLG